MASRSLSDLPSRLSECNSEEEVKAEFARAFKFKLDTRYRMDLYTPTALFEFKFEKNFQSLSARALVVAQALYYIREIKFGTLDLAIPRFICLVDKNESFIIETKDLKSIFGSQDGRFDWDRAPSTPCPNLVKVVAGAESVRSAYVYRFTHQEDFSNFQKKIENIRIFQPELDFSQLEKKIVTEENFESAYQLWANLFGAYVENGRKAGEYFLSDLQAGKSHLLEETHEVAFDMGGNFLIKKPMPIEKYKHFWNTYEKISDPRTVHSIWQRVDRLSVEDFRRFTGEFYTPTTFAHKGIEYLERVVGERWWEKGYRLWDMAAGTGNLQYTIPEAALEHCYISTLLKEDADYCARLYPQATVFQYDYLNDDVMLMHHSGLDMTKSGIPTVMPKKLLDDLQDPELKWIILINPPFATANVGSRDSDLKKDAVSKTQVRELMAQENLLETSRELFSQFLWRISKDFSGKGAFLGLFSKIKYINSNNDQKMRETFFKCRFEAGFCFPSSTFHGNKGKFPVGFLVWNISDPLPLKSQDIWLDIFNERLEKVGRKQVPSVERDDALSKWVERPRTKNFLPPLSSAISVADGRVDVRDGVADGFLFSLMAKGNDFANQNFTSLLSGPYVSAGAISVTPENFEKSMVWHAVRRIPKATWLNDRDQWMQPTSPLPQEFILDCVVWSAFSNSNQTASLAGIPYKGKVFDLPNNLFPFLLNDVKQWKCSLGSIEDSLKSATRDRYLANYLRDKPLSTESRAVLESARTLYEYFFQKSASVPWPQFKIQRWDVGLYQIRRSLEASDQGGDLLQSLSVAVNKLGMKLRPQISELGFLQGEEEFFENEVDL